MGEQFKVQFFVGNLVEGHLSLEASQAYSKEAHPVPGQKEICPHACTAVGF